jgi:ubiquitin carboxyl-terminal hydrolase 14
VNLAAKTKSAHVLAPSHRLMRIPHAAVPPERQKLMSKAWKGVLKDDVDFSTLSLADGLIISLMGSADTAAKAAADKLVFVEDMSAAEIVKAGHRIPSGLENTGNTCYANSE